MFDKGRQKRVNFEPVPLSMGESFAVRRFFLPQFSSPWHFHPEVELTWIVNSSGQRFVGDSIEWFGPGDLVLVGSSLPHLWRNSSAASRRRDYAHSLVIQFRADSFGQPFWDLPEMTSIRDLFRRAGQGLCFHGATQRETCKALRRIQGQTGARRLMNLLSILERLAESREFRCLASPGFRPRVDAQSADRLQRCYDFILREASRNIRLDEVAAVAGLSNYAFCRYFKKTTGKTLISFVNEIRISKACRLLIGTQMSITDVCFASGFNNLSNFNRQFRAIRRSSPREFRQRYTSQTAVHVADDR